MHTDNLKNKTVLITGASSGIGEACARYFAKAGAKVLLCARRAERLRKLADELQKSGAISHYFALDVSQKKQIDSAFQSLPTEWQAIDILVNNAGVLRGLHKFQEANLNDFEEMIDINLKGLLYMTRKVLPGMVQQDSGHIINIGSTASHDVCALADVYCATKHAVNAFTKALRLDLCGTKIRVTTVDPGAVVSELYDAAFKGDKDAAAAAFYKGYMPLIADDVAESIVYCASRPAHVNISEMIIMPTDQASLTQINRKT
jgi:3-hydroxy acid dehydrogenase / malonic semialdehyde reductase